MAPGRAPTTSMSLEAASSPESPEKTHLDFSLVRDIHIGLLTYRNHEMINQCCLELFMVSCQGSNRKLIQSSKCHLNKS